VDEAGALRPGAQFAVRICAPDCDQPNPLFSRYPALLPMGVIVTSFEPGISIGWTVRVVESASAQAPEGVLQGTILTPRFQASRLYPSADSSAPLRHRRRGLPRPEALTVYGRASAGVRRWVKSPTPRAPLRPFPQQRT
jgi:hypothetical protein